MSSVSFNGPLRRPAGQAARRRPLPITSSRMGHLRDDPGRGRFSGIAAGDGAGDEPACPAYRRRGGKQT
jgi:hypothetical protein